MGDFQAADAAPDDGFAAVVVPVDAPVKLAAVTAENNLGKTVIAGEAALFPGRARVNDAPADKLGLHLHEEVFRNNRLVVALNIVLRHDAVVLDALFRQEVRGVGLLKQGIAHVLLVAENLVDGAGVPLFLARAGEDSVCHKSGGNFAHAGAFEVFPVDAFYDFSLLRIDDQVTVRILGVAEKTIVIDVYLSLLEAVLKSQLYVLAHGLAFLLGKACHNRKEHLALSIQRVYGLLFKIDRDILVLELPDVLQAVESVSGKSADGLGDDHVDVSGHAFVNHAVELVTLFGVGTGDAVVREYARQLPFRIFLDVLRVMCDLRLVAGFLFLGIRADAAVGGYHDLFELDLRARCFHDFRYFFQGKTSGLMYCKDCGTKMHIRTIHKNGKVQHVTYCSEYAKGKAKHPKCNSPHRIDVDEVMENIAEVLRKIAQYSLENKAEFEKLVKESLYKEQTEEVKKNQKRMPQITDRMEQIERVMNKFYEDNALGNMDTERYEQLSRKYAEEYYTLKAEKEEMLQMREEIEEAKKEKARAYRRAYYKEYRAKNLEKCREYEKLKAREYRAKKKLQATI